MDEILKDKLFTSSETIKIENKDLLFSCVYKQ